MFLHTEKELITHASSCKRDWNKEMWLKNADLKKKKFFFKEMDETIESQN